MSYQNVDPVALLSGNRYPGRGILIGATPDKRKAMVAYFIMGRSENSRNRVFEATADGIRTRAYDPSKMADPSLIIYHPVRTCGNRLIVTNGDQTDTICEFLSAGKTFEAALSTRTFEPDAPNFTPRISGLLTFAADSFQYKLSILRAADAQGSACDRYVFSYAAQPGRGHLIHTYDTDGNPLPTFSGEPRRVAVPDDLEQFSSALWDALDSENKIALYVSSTDLATGKTTVKLTNKYHEKEPRR